MRRFSFLPHSLNKNHPFHLHTLPVIPVLCVLLAGCSICQNPFTTQSANEQFDNYTMQLFTQSVTGNTLTLHYTLAYPEELGISDYPLSLGQISLPEDTSAAAANENIMAALDQIPEKGLSTSRQLSMEVIKDALNTQNRGMLFPYYEEPLSPTGGLQTELPLLLAEYTFYDEQDVTDYLTLLASLPECFSQAVQYEKRKAQAGLFMSSAAADTVIAQCQAMTANADSHFLTETFNSRLSKLGLPDERAKEYQAQNEALVEQTVLPAFTQLAADLLELQGSEKNNQGLCYFPEGRAYYEYLVYQSTGSSKTVSQLTAAITQKRLQDLTETAELLDQNPDLTDQAAMIQQETSGQMETAGSGSSDAPSLVLAEEMLTQLEEAVQNDFPSLSRDINITVREVEPSLRSFLAPAFYLTCPTDEDTENVIYLNDDAEEDPLTLFTTLAHEGYPGHLLQTVYYNRQETCMLRHLLSYPGYVEGWATYAELTSCEYTGLEEDLVRFLQLEKSVILSLYSSADIGIHYEGWSLEQTEAFFSDYGIDNTEAIREVYEYIVSAPTNYLKYFVGYLEIEELKDTAIQKYGDTFSITAFHQALLTMGPAPFSVLEKYLPDYYTKVLSSSSSS